MLQKEGIFEVPGFILHWAFERVFRLILNEFWSIFEWFFGAILAASTPTFGQNRKGTVHGLLVFDLRFFAFSH